MAGGTGGGRMAPLGLALLVALLAAPAARALLPPGELKQLSAAGSKYIDGEVENAVEGVKRMKALMEQSSKEHRATLQSLQDAKRHKEEAVQRARAAEQRLAERRAACNGSAAALWEECKPCLKRTCVRLYSRVCHSGSALLGRQLEELLNRSSPFAVRAEGERLDALQERARWQERRFEELEESFGLLQDGVDDIFQESARVPGHALPLLAGPWRPAARRSGARGRRVARELRRFPSHPQPGFHRLFQPFLELTQRMFEDAQRLSESEPWRHPLMGLAAGSGAPASASQRELDPSARQQRIHVGLGRILRRPRVPGTAPIASPLPAEPRNSTDERLVCREIRRHSAGCLKMRDECEKCQEILSLDCADADEEQGQLREQLEEALRLAERFTRRYDELLGALQADVLNTTGLLEQLNRQFGWVSRLANVTQRDDGFLQVTTVLSKAPNAQDPAAPADTQVTVQLFEEEPVVLTVPGTVPWHDPRFMELVAEQALRHYKQRAL
ncbi:clusterin [Eudromia elegans]